MREKVINLKIMSKNKQHSELEMKCNKTRTAHSQVRYEYGFMEKIENGKSKYILVIWQKYMK